MSAAGYVGNYVARETFSSVAISGQSITSSELSKLIRSRTPSEEILQAIEKAKEVTNENLCDALDREVSMPIFQALISKIEKIGESPLTCALHQSRMEEFLKMFQSGKTTVPLESLLKKIRYKSDMAAVLVCYPELKAKVEADPELREKLVPPIPACRAEAPEQAEPEWLSWILERQKKDELITPTLKAEAMQAIEKRDFVTARHKADAIPNEIYRKGTMADIFTRCFEYGDLEAIECALALAKMHKKNRDGYISGFIDECTKLKDRDIAKEMSIKAFFELKNENVKSHYVTQMKKLYDVNDECFLSPYHE